VNLIMKRWTIVLLWVAWNPSWVRSLLLYFAWLVCEFMSRYSGSRLRVRAGSGPRSHAFEILLSFEISQVPSFLIYLSKNSTALVNDISTMRLVK
jgi:hypothetical protein